MRQLVFTDIETTGLDPMIDDIVEISIYDGTMHTFVLDHDVSKMSQTVRDLISYDTRNLATARRATDNDLARIRGLLKDNTMVAANPAFDAAFLKKRGLFTAHYRMLDIEAYAMAKFGLKSVPSMRDIVDELKKRGFTLPYGDHSSAGDVRTMYSAYVIMEKM